LAQVLLTVSDITILIWLAHIRGGRTDSMHAKKMQVGESIISSFLTGLFQVWLGLQSIMRLWVQTIALWNCASTFK
jgi:hypothetical protein